MRFRNFGPGYGILFLSVLLSGCLPSSCNRIESRVLLPADSLSRAFAETLPVDTLEAIGVIESSELLLLLHPRTIVFGEEGHLWLSDTKNNVILEFDENGDLLSQINAKNFKYPYIAGFRGDTLLVFSPDAGRILMIHEGQEVHSISIPEDRPESGTLEYVVARGPELYYKVLGEDYPGYVARLDDEGLILEKVELPRHYWQHAGFLRFWGDDLISLAGFRTELDILSEGSVPDTLVLFGFDSPMLARRRLYLLGETDQPPLLSASAVAEGEWLFVVNMRPGWLRVDVYDRDGQLRHILVEPSPEFNQNYYPSDIAVRRVENGVFELAIAIIQPEPRIERFRWSPK